MEKNETYKTILQNLISDRELWKKHANDCEEYYYGNVENTLTQFTSEQKKKIEEDYDILISVNLLFPVIEQLLAFLIGNKPSVRIIPVGESDKNTAYILQEIFTAVLYRSYTSEEIRGAVRDSCLTGSGFLLVQPNTFYSQNELGVIINHISWKDVYPDKNAKKWDLSDAEYILISKELTVDKAIKEYEKFGLTKEKVKSETGSSTRDIDIFNTRVEINDLYSKEYVKGGYLWKNGQLKNKPQYTGHKPLPAGIYIHERIFLNKDNIIWEGILPINHYPIIHFPCIHHPNSTNYKTYGMIHALKDPQIALNKTTAHMILNAQLHSHAKIVSVKGSVNKEEFAKWASNPKMMLEYEADNNLPNGGKPERWMPVPLSNAHYQLFQEIKFIIEYISGIWSVMQGNPVQAPDTFGGTQSLQMYGTQRIKARAGLIDMSLAKLCHCVINYIIAFAPRDKIYRYIDDSISGYVQDPQSGKMIRQVTRPNEPWREAKLLDKPGIGEYDVVAIPNPTTPTTKMLASTLLGTVSGQTRDPQVANLLTQYALKLLEIPEADEIVEKVDMIKQMQQQMAQMQQALEQMSQQAQMLSKENQQLRTKNMEQQYEHELDKNLIESRGKVNTAAEVAKAQIAGIVSDNEEEINENENIE